MPVSNFHPRDYAQKQNRTNYVGRRQLVSLIAKEARFSQKDVNTILTTLINVIPTIIKNGRVLNIASFGKFYVREIDVGDITKPAWDNIHARYYDRPVSRRIVFKVSSTLKKALKQELKNDEQERIELELMEDQNNENEIDESEFKNDDEDE